MEVYIGHRVLLTHRPDQPVPRRVCGRERGIHGDSPKPQALVAPENNKPIVAINTITHENSDHTFVARRMPLHFIKNQNRLRVACVGGKGVKSSPR